MGRNNETRCRHCHRAATAAYASYARHHNHVCRQCASAVVRKSRHRDPVRLLAYRWSNALRRRGVQPRSSADTQEAVRSIVKRWGMASVLSGTCAPEDLCVVPFYRQSAPPDAAWNAVPVTKAEARVLSHLRSEERRQARFPHHVTAHMRLALEEQHCQ